MSPLRHELRKRLRFILSVLESPSAIGNECQRSCAIPILLFQYHNGRVNACYIRFALRGFAKGLR